MKVMNINKTMRQSDTLYTVPSGKVAKIFLNSIKANGTANYSLYMGEGFFVIPLGANSNYPMPKDAPVLSEGLVVFNRSSEQYTAVPRIHYLTAGETLRVSGPSTSFYFRISATVFEESI